ncbi:LysR family transcriptional regulator [Vibrio inusitatus NBRC 102082]|uniref:LysR family transcriptional regulator n=1 Tax=Vibrio inusitatus NBRC 102082 TaxID=1219070 RepID=A0A4Y3HYE7_9VIBR|nr:LysR family transcriptional regulator [Vibrio inusitatus]GEA52127.1 LysR family transcriptional regulator [Vibrio inusitatus NBRC 102082]
MNSPITLDALKVLDAIDRKKSFAGAADELFRVPSAISYTVNKLEEDLGVALYDRTKRKAELTDIGRMVLEQGRLILTATETLTNVVRQSASGWEVELRIGVDSMLSFRPLYDLIEAFQMEHPWIAIKVVEEVLGGSWDALTADRCDLVIGAAGSTSDSSIATSPLGTLELIFAVSPHHPLCKAVQPLSEQVMKEYPSVVVADSSRTLETRSAGLLDGQSRITVPSISKKIEAQLQGLGVGYLPVHRIQQELQLGQLVALEVERIDQREPDIHLAWHKNNKGKALSWFVKKIQSFEHNLFLSA